MPIKKPKQFKKKSAVPSDAKPNQEKVRPVVNKIVAPLKDEVEQLEKRVEKVEEKQEEIVKEIESIPSVTGVLPQVTHTSEGPVSEVLKPEVVIPESEGKKDGIDTTSMDEVAADKSADLISESNDSEPKVIDDSPPEERVPEEPLDLGSDSGSKTKKTITIMLIIMVLGLVVLAWYFYTYIRIKPQSAPKGPAVVPTQAGEEKPTPTVELSKYSLQVLNGTRTAGLAGRASEMLKTQGFAEITVGNAPTSTSEITEIKLKESIPDAVYMGIEKALSDSFATQKATESLPNDSLYDIVIIVGRSK